MIRLSCPSSLALLAFAPPRRTLLLLAAIAVLLAPTLARADDAKVVFNRDIRPILSENCFACHGPDQKARKAKLRLDTREGALDDREARGPALVPGKQADSLVVQRIVSDDAEQKMPPPQSGKKLTAQQIELMRKWVDQGAEWQLHWSFLKPENPTLPPVKDAQSVRNPIDRFVVARLEKDGLKLSPRADRITLIRRVTLDLRGLPPTPAEVDAFLADQSADAYEKVVDRLLNSPRYGEHMTRHWLDLVRYGDTHGLHFDNERALWKYREWVINAFNNNMPFDRFTIDQLAGDLVPNGTIDQKIATGFNRCNVTSNEGGSINEELLVRYAVDRTSTVGTIYLGLGLGCAVCHDHKFDPITQKDFYRLMAFYDAAADGAMDGNIMAPPPVLRLPTKQQEQRLKEIDEQLVQKRKQIADTLATIEYKDVELVGPPAPPKTHEVVWIDDALPNGAQPGGGKAWDFVAAPDFPVHSGTKSVRNVATGVGQQYFEGAPNGPRLGEGDKLFAYIHIDPKAPPRTIMLQFNDGAWEHRAFWGEDLVPFGAANTPAHLSMGELPKAGEWVRLEVEASKVNLKPGTVLRGWAFTQFDGTAYWDKAGIVTQTKQGIESFKSLSAWEAFEKTQNNPKVPQPIKDLLKVAEEKRNDAQKKQLRDHFLEIVYAKTRPTFEPLHKEIEKLDNERKAVDAAIPATMVMADTPNPRPSFVLIRGQYDKHGEKVTPGTPAILPPMAKDAPPNRLGMAQWLVSPDNPLTARVTVNRFWQQYFGRGIVKTAEDFGAQGEWPTHPELLDWLAVEFVRSGWDVKHMQKLIVMSAAYQQVSDVTPELLKRDPENMLISRGPRFRLDAEVVRDSALFLSGLLSEEVGGRSVKPYQPPGIWEAIGFNGSNTRDYKRETGINLYRRSLYTFWKRTAPPPSLMAFDAPSRETCVARRSRTNTPLQALVLMNDEQYVEAARHLAERIMTEEATPDKRLGLAFRLATARAPTENEQKVLLKVFDKHLQHYRSNADAAVKLLSVGESKRDPKFDPAECAAYTMVANLILNLDETITKE
jgi:mono/diheme cytochrome c family protein